MTYPKHREEKETALNIGAAIADDQMLRLGFEHFLARLHEVQKSYCSHPGRTRSRSRSRSTLR